MAGQDREAFLKILKEVAIRTKQDSEIQDLGDALKIRSGDITSAHVGNRHGVSHMGSFTLLKTWLQGQDPSTMKQTLIDALKEIPRIDILNDCFPEAVADNVTMHTGQFPSRTSRPPTDTRSDSTGQHSAAGQSHSSTSHDKWQNRTVRPAKSGPDESDREMQYVMWESLVKGNALVIGNKDFPKKENLEESNRTWAKKDITNMSRLLGALGYKVQDDLNLSTSGMKAAVQAFTEQLKRAHPEPQSAVVYISSHGNAEGIEGIDRNILPIPILLHKMSGVLLGKPKVLIIDACWGGGETRRLQVSVPNFSSGAQTQTSYPENADIFMIHSTSYGKQAWSYTDKGSWFVKQLCDVVYNNDRDLEDLDTIMLRVTQEMHTMTAHIDGRTDNGTQSTTVLKQGVGRKLFFYPGFQI